MFRRWLQLFFFSIIAPAMGLASSSWKDSFVTRVELLAVIETFNAELLSHASATATLERWCADHGLAANAKITAKLDRSAEKPLGEAGRALLALQPAAGALPACAAFLRREGAFGSR